MIYKNLLLSITVIAFFLVSADAEASDPLSPSQLGESMSMPLSPELLQDARNAGVITGSNPLNEPDSQKPSFSVAAQTEEDTVNSIENVNLTGIWSFDLIGEAPEQIKLNLIQKEGAVMGRGVINRGNGSENATASGSISGDELRIIVMPFGTMDMYEINLSLSALSAGTYTIHEADGSSRSGEVTFAVSSNVFKPQSVVSEDKPSANAAMGSAVSAAAAVTPVQLSGSQGSSGRISSSKSTSMSSGGGYMGESSSSSSFSGSIM